MERPLHFAQGDVISYMEMCSAIGVNLQRGMNFRLCGAESVILMSRREGAPYDDQVEEDGRTLIYEGHDCSKGRNCRDPKAIDQPEHNPSGSLSQNGLFAEAVRRFKETGELPERVRVFEKIRDGIWVYNGVFELLNSKSDYSTGRRVFKFTLRLLDTNPPIATGQPLIRVEDDRIIPSWVKLAVWKRDQGQCVKCGSNSSLHFDHIIPYSKGGSSKDPENVQILCGRHNLAKRDKIE
jgi:hypothetical protein